MLFRSAARIAAGHGAKVAIAEESRVGGTCVIRGCVPKKLLVYAARFHGEFEDAAGFGWSFPAHGGGQFSWPALIANKDKEIDRLERAYNTQLNTVWNMVTKAKHPLMRRFFETIASRVRLLLGKHGLLGDEPTPDSDDAPSALDACQAASLRNVVALGPRAGRPLRKIMLPPPPSSGVPTTHESRGVAGFDLDVGPVAATPAPKG